MRQGGISIICLHALSAASVVCGQPAPADRTPAIAISGGTEISEIRITRWKASYSAKKADLTNMRIDFWFADPKWGGADHHLVSVKQIEPIKDSTGKLLSTKKRLEANQAVNGEILTSQNQVFLGKRGPMFELTLDAPAREATTIKAIKGKADVARTELEALDFDLDKVLGKPLSHPSLKNFKIEPSIQVNDGDTEVTLRVPESHAKLYRWFVAHKTVLRSTSEGGTPSPAGTVGLTTTYRGKLPKGCILRLIIAKPVESKTFEFHFKDIDLP
jgi:hypothetical protein